MRVSEIMTNAAVTDQPDDTLGEAASKMWRQQTGSLLVMEGEDLVGILTERDVLHAAAQTGDLDGASVGQHMTSPVVTASTSWDVTVAATEMTHRQIRHLVVVEQDQPLGVVSLRDVLSVFLPERVHQHEA